MFSGIIYKAISPSGKSYFGKTTKTLNRRIQHHHQSSKNPKFHFSSAIKKYGLNNFSWNIIETFEKETMEELQKILNERENFWIQKERTYLREKAINVKKIKCEHCQMEFTPWGLSNHLKKLNTVI